MNLKAFAVLAFALLGLVQIQAQAQDLDYKVDRKLSYLGVGVGGVAVSSSDASLTGFAIDVNYRRNVLDPKVSFYGQIAPIFQSSSLFGLQATAAIGYQVYGTSQIVTQFSDQGQPLLSQSTPDSNIKGFVDAGFTLLPVFGSNSTASYSGLFIEASAYSAERQLSASLQAHLLGLGNRNITMFGLFVNYYWNMK